MANQYPALEWLQRRAEGEPVQQIARRAGVPPFVVQRATDPYGPFPDPGSARQAAAAARAVRWVQLRKEGIPVVEIAATWNVSHQQVSRVTRDAGPYPRPGPAPNQVNAWVEARRTGVPISAIAAEHRVTIGKVATATQPYGPFPRPRHRVTPEGMYCRNDIARLLRIPDPTVLAWERRGYLPLPDVTTSSGRRLWKTTTVDTWVSGAGLATCPTCGARVRDVLRHQVKHQERGALPPGHPPRRRGGA